MNASPEDSALVVRTLLSPFCEGLSVIIMEPTKGWKEELLAEYNEDRRKAQAPIFQSVQTGPPSRAKNFRARLQETGLEMTHVDLRASKSCSFILFIFNFVKSGGS